MPGDILNLLGEDGLKMTQLISNIYKTGEWPKNFIDVKMSALKKEPKATNDSDHITISLIAHTAKIVARLLKKKE